MVTQVLTAQYERSSFQGREKGPQPLRVGMSRSHYKKSFFAGEEVDAGVTLLENTIYSMP